MVNICNINGEVKETLLNKRGYRLVKRHFRFNSKVADFEESQQCYNISIWLEAMDNGFTEFGKKRSNTE